MQTNNTNITQTTNSANKQQSSNNNQTPKQIKYVITHNQFLINQRNQPNHIKTKPHKLAKQLTNHKQRKQVKPKQQTPNAANTPPLNTSLKQSNQTTNSN